MNGGRSRRLKLARQVLDNGGVWIMSSYGYYLTEDGQIMKKGHGRRNAEVWATKEEVDLARNMIIHQKN